MRPERKLQSPRPAGFHRAFSFASIALVVLCAAAAPRALAKTAPVIHWSTPGPVRYGTPLNSHILQARVSGDLPGTFVYSPVAGMVLGAGIHSLSVTFNPTDTADYNSVSTTVHLTVETAVLVVGAFNVNGLTYGDPVPALRFSIKNFVNGDTLSAVSGAPVVTTPALQGSPVGQYPITPTLGTLAAANYSFTLVPGTLTVAVAPLFVHAYNVGPLPYGDAIPPLHYSIVGFRNGETQSIVTGAPSITTAAVVGSAPGQYPIAAALGTLTAPNYSFELFGATLTIVTQTPRITWSTPAAIVYGTALGAAQLDATEHLPGTYIYTPAAGTVLGAGTQTLSVTFTPNDTADYNSATATVQLTVNKRPPTIREVAFPGPVGLGDPLTMRATLNGGGVTPTGTVTFWDGKTSLGSGPLNSSGVATLSTDAPALGKQFITAKYSGDSNYLALTSPALEVLVVPATTISLAITSSGDAVTSVSSGAVVALKATVTVGSTPVTAGTVNFCVAAAANCTDTRLVGTSHLTGAGIAEIKFRPGVGSRAYTAVYGGTTSVAPGNSATEPLTVTGLYPSTGSVAQSGNAGDYTLTATIGGNGETAPTGTVSYLDISNGNSTLAKVTLGGSSAGLNFLPTSSVAGVTGVSSMAVGDFNGDGFADLAIENGSVLILLGAGDGTFALKSTTAADQYSGSMIVGDFNGDGVLDVATSGAWGLSANVLLGNGDGTLKAGPGMPQGGNMVAGDFNRDGNLDIADLNQGDDSIFTLLGNGDGTFVRLPMSKDPPISYYPRQLLEGDFTGDGIPDMLLTGSYTGAVFMEGNGDGTFTTSGTSIPGAIDTVILGDFNGDGVQDLAVLDTWNSELRVLLSNGDGTFTLASSLPLTTGLFDKSIAAGDFNGDGITDLAIAGKRDDSLTVFLGNGDGTFANPIALSLGISPNAIVAGDFKGGGVSDLAVVDGSGSDLSMLLAVNQAAAATATSVAVPGTGTYQIVASYSGDSNYKPSTSAPTPLTAGNAAAGASSAGPK